MKLSYIKKKHFKQGKPKIYGFMHIATMNNWKDVVNELMDFTKKNGLFDKTSLLTQVVIGPERFLIKKRKKIKVVSFGPKLDQYEYPTLLTLWERCMSSDEEFYVYYVHTKGVSYGPNAKSDVWRRVMATAILSKGWRDCVKTLDSGQDTCGIMMRNSHYSGNFWWSKASYIRTLKRPLRSKNRFVHERWLNTHDSNLKGDWPVSAGSMGHWYRRNYV